MVPVGRTVVHGAFEWDEDKAARNWSKHAVTFIEAATALLDPRGAEVADEVHDDRFRAIGISDRARVLCVVAAERGERTRIISARRATAEERELYEEG